jgi:hypothetical protein
MTSGFLNLYAGPTAELELVVGHELGRVKCRHGEFKKDAFGPSGTGDPPRKEGRTTSGVEKPASGNVAAAGVSR